MYSMLKKVITEKDMLRQISLLEQLLNYPSITAKELAQELQTTERTIFSDLQLIRDQLPTGWFIDSSSQGIQLKNTEKKLANELLTVFLTQSVSVQLIKSLLFTQTLSTPSFLYENGLSLETLKRHTAKINKQLKEFDIQIKIGAKTAELHGDESAIRIFYHRLLLPFTHNNYFFDDYSIHEEHYFQFLQRLNQSDLSVDTEQIFGACWFFINTIRIKANCRINTFSFHEEDSLYALYAAPLTRLYQTEGIYLQNEECFFAFFCFLESWNYNNTFGNKINLHSMYPALYSVADQLTQQVICRSNIPLQESKLTENLTLLLLKYNESTLLSQQFQLEYQELLTDRKQSDRHQNDEEILTIIQDTVHLENPAYLMNLISLLEQQALFAYQPKVMTAYFLFQGEPAWKAFLQQELTDLLGRRVSMVSLELSQVAQTLFQPQDLIVSNFLLEEVSVPICYISTMPTKNELRQLTELTLKHYL